MHMNAEVHMTGERLAKLVAARAAALEVINSASSPPLWWHYCFLIILGIGQGWLVSHSGQNGNYVLGSVAGAGFFLAIAAFIECIRLRKRLDATISLLRISEQR